MTFAGNLSPSTHSLAEQWVLKQVTTGNEADLKNQFPDKKDWVLSASFLERLLAGSFGETKLHRHGVRIKNAIFNDPIDLANAQVLHETRLIGCLFEKEVNLSNSILNKDFYLDGSTFSSSVNFRAMKVAGTLSSPKAIFMHEADFSEVEVIRSLVADGAEFRNSDQKVNFNNIKVGYNFFIKKTKFLGPLNFAGAVINGSINATDAEFKKKKEVANFSNMKVDGHAFFFDAKFSGPVSFRTTIIAGNFLVTRGEFSNTEQGADFILIKVGGVGSFSGVKFSGPVTFLGAEIKGNFEVFEAEFRHLNQGANFNSMKVGGNVHVEKSIFSGPVNFASMNIIGSFEVGGAEFRNMNQGTTFNSTKVGRQAIFDNAKFLGPVDFGNAEITSNFKADEANFKGKATFSGMQVGGRASFIKTAFGGDVVIEDAKLLHLSIQGPEEKYKTNFIPLLDLSRTEIKGELQIQNVILQSMMANSIKVLGPTVLRNLTIKNKLSLEYSTFLNISLLGVSWPKSEKSVRLNGMTYQYISAGDKKDSWERLLELVKESAYDANNYTNLEAFFRRQGYPGQAEEIFIEQKRQERKEFLKERDIRWFWSLLLEYLVGHGRKPERALIWSGFFIMMGYFIFRRKEGMELRRPEETSPNYNAMWYSLDLFLPLVRLQVEDLWRPRRDRWFARNYAHFHKILGAILIPFGLAAVTGIIK